MSEAALAAVLIPARNERDDIGACLDAVLAQDLPLEQLEVVVVDGGSTDGTAERAAERLAAAGVARWEVVDNPVGTTPSNLNRGLERVTADVVCRVDARSRIPADYVRRCAALLRSRPELAVVGGAQVALPPGVGPVPVGIARALNNRYAMGGSRYRRGAASGGADTVYLGAFRTADLREAGGWDERLGTNQDFDLNRRMSARGLVWFEAGLEVGYLPRPTLGKLAAQYRRFGEGKVRYWYLTGDPPRPRQLVLLGAPLVAGAGGLAVLSRLGWPARGAAVAAAAAGALAVEVRGSSGPDGPPSAHAVAVVAQGIVAGCWLAGVWRALVRQAAGRPVVGTASGVSR